MPRPLRVEYPGAMYHVMSRADRREAIFEDDKDRQVFLRTLGEASAKTGWEIHAYVLMNNHFHLVLETPQPNLSVGMKWLLGTYTQRWNRRWRRWGHLFGGRYKAQCIDERSPSYLRTACDYVHLNPERARLVSQEEGVEGRRKRSILTIDTPLPQGRREGSGVDPEGRPENRTLRSGGADRGVSGRRSR